jgi:hypothetical protein
MLRVLVPVLVFGLAVYSLLDCIQTPEHEVRHIPKVWWIVLIVLVPTLGPLAWLVTGRLRSWPLGPGARGAGPSSGPRGPEDDPDFLRKL